MKPIKTDSALYDLLQELFGLGTWHPDLSDDPWWKARQLEVSKIKRSRTSRRVELEHLALAARYAKAHGEDVRAITWLYKLISPAIQWDNERRRNESLGELDDLIAEAVQIESDQPESEWLSRLVRARGPHRKEVHASWIEHRDSLPSPNATDQERGHPTASSA